MKSTKFNHSMKTLHKEIDRLYGIGEELPAELFERSDLYAKILEMKAALGLLDGYVYKVREDG